MVAGGGETELITDNWNFGISMEFFFLDCRDFFRNCDFRKRRICHDLDATSISITCANISQAGLKKSLCCFFGGECALEAGGLSIWVSHCGTEV